MIYCYWLYLNSQLIQRSIRNSKLWQWLFTITKVLQDPPVTIKAFQTPFFYSKKSSSPNNLLFDRTNHDWNLEWILTSVSRSLVRRADQNLRTCHERHGQFLAMISRKQRRSIGLETVNDGGGHCKRSAVLSFSHDGSFSLTRVRLFLPI